MRKINKYAPRRKASEYITDPTTGYPKYGMIPTGYIYRDDCGRELPLYRIICQRNLRTVRGAVLKGSAGGLVSGFNNLSHEGSCWIFPQATVSGEMLVEGDAIIKDNGYCSGCGHISGNCVVCGTVSNAVIEGRVMLDRRTVVRGNKNDATIIYGSDLTCSDGAFIGRNVRIVVSEGQISGIVKIEDFVCIHAHSLTVIGRVDIINQVTMYCDAIVVTGDEAVRPKDAESGEVVLRRAWFTGALELSAVGHGNNITIIGDDLSRMPLADLSLRATMRSISIHPEDVFQLRQVRARMNGACASAIVTFLRLEDNKGDPSIECRITVLQQDGFGDPDCFSDPIYWLARNRNYVLVPTLIHKQLENHVSPEDLPLVLGVYESLKQKWVVKCEE
jgi:hypothetical protein